MVDVNKMLEAFKKQDVKLATLYFTVETNDEITNEVRNELDCLTNEEIVNIQGYLYKLLNLCYDRALFDNIDNNEYDLVKMLDDNKKFLLKETVIYFLGRLNVNPDVNILKTIYFLEENKHLKLNIAFSSLITFDEEIEMDFVDKISYGNEYDKMIRSWTMAYFKGADNPYLYVDKEDDDWQEAKMPRIKRLAINEETNPKFTKAMSFRLLDLVVLDLFLENRRAESLSDSEKEIVKNAYIDYPLYSSLKKEKMSILKDKIINR